MPPRGALRGGGRSSQRRVWGHQPPFMNDDFNIDSEKKDLRSGRGTLALDGCLDLGLELLELALQEFLLLLQ